MYHRPFLIGALFNCVETVLEIKCNYSLAVNFFIVLYLKIYLYE